MLSFGTKKAKRSWREMAAAAEEEGDDEAVGEGGGGWRLG